MPPHLTGQRKLAHFRDIAPAGRVYHILLVVAREEFFVDKDIKELERDFLANRLKIDRLNRAYYGMTFDELVRLKGKYDEDKRETETAQD